MEVRFRRGTFPKSQQTQKSSKWGPEPPKGAPGLPKLLKITTFASQNRENSIAKMIQKYKQSQKMKPTKRHGGGIARSALDNIILYWYNNIIIWYYDRQYINTILWYNNVQTDGRRDGFGHGRVWPDSDTEGYDRILTDGRIRTQNGMTGFGRTDTMVLQ